MRRRLFLTAMLGAAMPGLAHAQGVAPGAAAAPPQPPPTITPENELERTFLAALTDETVRPAFRRELLASQLPLALASDAADAGPRYLQLRPGLSAGAIFTSPSRMNSVLGPASARRVMSGREALTRLRGRNVVLNYQLTPMLTLEPVDVAAWLDG